MSTALGIRLNIESATDGVGFVNPQPLPDFPAGLQALHLLRRSTSFSAYNRVSLLPERLTAVGVEFRASEMYAEKGTNFLDYVGPPVDPFNFTIGLAARLRSPVDESDRSLLIATSDWDESAGKGFRINLQSSGAADLALVARAHRDGERWRGSNSFDLPADNARPVLIFAAFNGSDLLFMVPGAGLTASITQEAATAVDPDPDPSWVFGRSFPQASADSIVDLGFSAFAQWGRALTESEILDAHGAMKEWGSAFGADFY